jgi:catechol 2,3-dioxygenase-like lactoylglutathione lyase family enzyme
MLGRFHELSIPTPDIRASVEFYERLGFTQAETGDVWSHPYGVMTDGRIVLGLHQQPARPLSVTFVRPDVVAYGAELERRGVRLAFSRAGSEVFNEIGLTDPGGNLIAVLEARTYSPPAPRAAGSLCGYFMQLSLPASDFAAAGRFWEPLGFVATDESDVPYLHLPLTSDHLNVAFHRPRTLDRQALVFLDEDMGGRIARLRELGIAPSEGLPSGLDPGSNAIIEAPEGTPLLLLSGVSF